MKNHRFGSAGTSLEVSRAFGGLAGVETAGSARSGVAARDYFDCLLEGTRDDEALRAELEREMRHRRGAWDAAAAALLIGPAVF